MEDRTARWLGGLALLVAFAMFVIPPAYPVYDAYSDIAKRISDEIQERYAESKIRKGDVLNDLPYFSSEDFKIANVNPVSNHDTTFNFQDRCGIGVWETGDTFTVLEKSGGEVLVGYKTARLTEGKQCPDSTIFFMSSRTWIRGLQQEKERRTYWDTIKEMERKDRAFVEAHFQK